MAGDDDAMPALRTARTGSICNNEGMPALRLARSNSTHASSGITPKLYATQLDDEVPPRILEVFQGLRGTEPPVTVYDVLKTCKDGYGEHNAMAYKRPSKGVSTHDIGFTFITWQDYYTQASMFARALISLGFKNHQSINILGFNAPEWFISWMGAVMIGGVAAGVYLTNGPQSCHYISENSEAAVVVVDSPEQLNKYKMVTEKNLPKLKALVVWGHKVPADYKPANPSLKVYDWDAFMALGKDVPAEKVEERAKAVQPGHCATLIYTSGTTGPPKGVMLSHDNLTWAASQAEPTFPGIGPKDKLLSYLPLSHVAAQVIDVILPLTCGGCVYFAQPDALKGSLIHALREVRPSFFLAVPRVWEKFYESMQMVRTQVPVPVRAFSDFFKDQMKKHLLSTQYGEELVEPWGLNVATKMLKEVHAKLGLDNCRVAASGAAPLSLEIAQYFASIGVVIFEAFGMSETTGLATYNMPGSWKLGTVGRPCPGETLRLDPETGELQIRGRSIFMGYLKMQEKTQEALLPGGWLRTGDVATFDADHHPEVPKPSGFLRITGRIKELIITAGGENIPPTLIEDEIKAALPGVASAMVVGDRRKFLTVLLTLLTDDEGKLTSQSKSAGQSIGSNANTPAEARNDPKWQKYFNDGIKAANSKATSRAQFVQKWSLLDKDFNEAAGELTPTLKLKRNVCAKKYEDVIEEMYRGCE